MMTIFHITTESQWQNALEQGFYLADSLEKEGFIHASTAQQHRGVHIQHGAAPRHQRHQVTTTSQSIN